MSATPKTEPRFLDLGLGTKREPQQNQGIKSFYQSQILALANLLGQTTNLRVRLQEHRDGQQPQTKERDPRLVYFEQFDGARDEVRERENDLTRLNQTGAGRRRLREMIERFREPLRLLDLDA